MPSKKTSTFSCLSPLSAQQLGFTIGPFEHVDLAEFREGGQDDKLGQNAVPLHGFCLPGRAEEVSNTCFPMAKVGGSIVEKAAIVTILRPWISSL